MLFITLLVHLFFGYCVCEQLDDRDSELSAPARGSSRNPLHWSRDLFIFFYNQITESLKRCCDPNCKMKLLRASCQEQAWKAVSSLVPCIPRWDVDDQI